MRRSHDVKQIIEEFLSRLEVHMLRTQRNEGNGPKAIDGEDPPSYF